MAWDINTLDKFLESTIQCHFKEVYIGVGCFVDRPESYDQQLPNFIARYATNATEGPAAAVLFDPKFTRNIPISIGVRKDICWVSNGYHHSAGSLTVVVVNSFLEKRSRFYPALCHWIQRHASEKRLIRLAVFTQPYLRVEENFEIIDTYHTTLRTLSEENRHFFRYLHLAAYAMERPDRGTRMWVLPAGTEHDQDVAILKEVARYKGNGPSFGVACTLGSSTTRFLGVLPYHSDVSGYTGYAAFPGKQFCVVNPASGGVDYEYIQKQVEDALVSSFDPIQLLEQNEHYINEIT